MTAAPSPGPAPLRLSPVQRAFEGGLILAVVFVALASWLWGKVLVPRATPVPLSVEAPADGDTTFERLGALKAQGRDGPFVAAQVIIGVACALSWGALITIFVRRGGLPGLRAAWRERTADLPGRGPTVGQAFVAFGVMTLGSALTLHWVPCGRLEVQGPSPGQVVVHPSSVDGLHLGGPAGERSVPIPGVEARRVTLGAHGRVSLAGDAQVPVRVRGVERTRGGFDLKDGDALEVGPLRATWRGPDRLAVAWHQVLTYGAMGAALLLSIWPLLGRDAHRHVGLVGAGLPREALRGLVGWLAVLPVFVAVMTAWLALGAALGIPRLGHPTIGLLERGGPALALAVVLQAAVLAPFIEELLWRGIILPAFARVLGAGAAIVATALVFGSLHTGFESLAPIALQGALYATLAATSPARSLVGSMVAHGLFNGGQLALVLAVQAATS